MFSYKQKVGQTHILFDNQVILQFVDEHLLFRCFRIDNMRLRPGGPVECMTLLTSAFYGFHLLRAHVTCECHADDHIRIQITPDKVENKLTEWVWEQRSIDIHYDRQRHRFRYRFTVDLDFRADIKGGEGLAITPMPQWGADDYAIVEFDDPLLGGGVGPQVPMTQDWQGLGEPCLAEDCFTTTWQKRYRSVAMHTSERGPQRIMFNRVVNGVQQFYNRHVLKCAPKTPYYYEKADGRYLRYTPHFDFETGHHICEWGFDVHLYALLPKASDEALFEAGQSVKLVYEFEEVDGDEVPAAFANAELARIESDERVLADCPIYEEPICRFADSTLDCPDAYGWNGSDTCHWNRQGGRQEGQGALEIRNGDTTQDSKWTFAKFGPSYACNPIPPNSCHRVTARVQADDLAALSLTLQLVHYNGPAMCSPGERTVSSVTGVEARAMDDGWHELSFVSERCGSYTLSGQIEFAYEGVGTASLCELSIERL